MKVNGGYLHLSFVLAGISQEALHTALRAMLPAALKAYDAAGTKAMRAEWSPENPTRFSCYFVSEMVYWYLAPPGSRACALEVPGDATLHRFVQWPDGEIVDLTCDQFDHYELLDYSKSVPKMFMQTGGVGPSKRARQLAALLSLTLPVR